MLDDFIRANRDAIIGRVQKRVGSRAAPKANAAELADGIPAFLDQLCEALQIARSTDVVDHEQIRKSAGRHASHMLRMGLTIAQVVHDYGDVCQSITALAVGQQELIAGDEFRILNLCLDDAIAEAVTEYSRQREVTIAEQSTERLGVLAHELRNLLNTAILSFESIRGGLVPVGGSTAHVHSGSLMRLRNLVDRSLADVRLTCATMTGGTPIGARTWWWSR